MTTGLEVRVREGRERAAVSRVTQTLTQIIQSLADIDQAHLLRGTRPVWVMADMSRRRQDLIVRIEPRYVAAKRTLPDMLVPVEALVSGVSELADQPVVPDLFAPKTVTRIADLAEPRDGIQSITLATYNGRVEKGVELSDPVRTNAESAVKAFEVSYGSVYGDLFGVREARGSHIRVTVRSEQTRQVINGTVPDALREALRSAWTHRVALIGKVRRNARGQAISIDADQIEILPEDDSGRPSTVELLGLGANLVHGLTVDDLMRELRDA